MKYFGMFKKKSDFPPKPKRLTPEQINHDLQDVDSHDPIMKLLNGESGDLNEDDNRMEQIQEVMNNYAELNSRRTEVATCLNTLDIQQTSLAQLSSHLKSFLHQISPDST